MLVKIYLLNNVKYFSSSPFGNIVFIWNKFPEKIFFKMKIIKFKLFLVYPLIIILSISAL